MIKKKETIFSLEKYDIEHKKYETIKTICRYSLTFTYIAHVLSLLEGYGVAHYKNKLLFIWNCFNVVNILLNCSFTLYQAGENGIQKRKLKFV